MDIDATNDHSSNAPYSLNTLHGNQSNQRLDNEALERRIDNLRREADRYQSPTDSSDFTAYRPYMGSSHTIRTQLDRALNERSRRAGLAPVFGTREEVERQGSAYQSPITSLLRQQLPAQNNVSDEVDQHRDSAAAGSHQTRGSNPWLVPMVAEPQGGMSGVERVGARHQQDDGVIGQPGSYPSVHQAEMRTVACMERHAYLFGGLGTRPNSFYYSPEAENFPSFTSNMRVQRPRYQSSISQEIASQSDEPPPIWRQGNRSGGAYASDASPPNFFLSSNLGRPQMHASQEEATGTGGPRLAHHLGRPGAGRPRALPTPAALGTTNDTSFDDFLARVQAPLDSGRSGPLASQQTLEQQTAQRAAVIRQYREGELRNMQQLRLLHARQRLLEREEEQRPAGSLDNDITRPDPIKEEAKMVKMECKICFSQVSNHVVLPCGMLHAHFHLELSLDLADEF
ncbi:MAG: hypothetical protein Q9218_001170 [Villophora microphyllina]